MQFKLVDGFKRILQIASLKCNDIKKLYYSDEAKNQRWHCNLKSNVLAHEYVVAQKKPKYSTF